jgi:hypothetical protein
MIFVIMYLVEWLDDAQKLRQVGRAARGLSLPAVILLLLVLAVYWAITGVKLFHLGTGELEISLRGFWALTGGLMGAIGLLAAALTVELGRRQRQSAPHGRRATPIDPPRDDS